MSISFKHLLLNTSAAYYINLLPVRKSHMLSRYHHTGTVHALLLKGRWYYLEHDWVAEEKSFAYKPLGEIYMLFVSNDISEMITLFIVHGGYTYVDPYGKVVGYEDVFKRLEATREH